MSDPRIDRADSSATESVSLPPDLLAEASRRLGWAAMIYSGVYLLAYTGPNLIAWATVPAYRFNPLQNAFAAGSIALGLVVLWLSRSGRVSPARLLDLGLVFEVVASLGISAVQFWHGFPPIETANRRYVGVPWECPWIMIFPVLAPNSPRKVLIASLASASMGPLMVAFTAARGVAIGRTPVMVVTFFLFTTYLCAVAAYVISRIVNRYGVRLKRARDIGSYELVMKLGEGGMGEVWVARHRMLARPAAVKLIRPELLGHDQQPRERVMRRFEREATATAALRSTHTIDVYDFGVTEDGAFFYVMEFLEGLNLDAIVRRFGPVGPGRTIYLMRQVCHSLGEAHARGLIHRDIKPANIFSSRLGPDCDFVKVLDFGLVKETTDEGSRPDATAPGGAAGTPAFMAPEMALGSPDVDGRADIYALGCVAYWLLTGQPVFKGTTPVATMLSHVREAPVAPSSRTETPVPAALDALILDCLAKDPAAPAADD